MVSLGPAVLLLAATSTVVPTLASPRVSIAQGDLVGTWMKTREGRRIAAFRGIPYAAPPTRQLRFKSPQPPDPWRGRKFAMKDGPECFQFTHFFGIQGEEDCLYLNVFSPNISSVQKLPVLFFIHGGAFRAGSGDSMLYGPKYLLDQDVVLVTVNYRLGVFGFLSLDNDVIPGNMGLKDQRAALRWVRDNIEQFGGDPRAVTLFGESAGAVCAHLHIMFNSDEGLFRAGILHSGAAVSAWGFQRPGDQKPLVKHILDKTGCPEGDSSSILDCLQKVPPFRLTRIAQSFSSSPGSLVKRIDLSPVMEPGCVEDAFITDDPWKKTTSLPMIIGTNQYEGMFIIEDLLKDETNEKFKKYSMEFENIIPLNLMFNTSAEHPLNITKQLKEFYIKDEEIKRENYLELVDLLSDGIFNYAAATAVKNNNADTYLYSFKYFGTKSFMHLLGYENNLGPTHIDDLFMFFPMTLISRLAERRENKTEEDLKMSKELVRMWINFAYHMTPVPEGSDVLWQPVSNNNLHYLSINGPGNFSVESDFYKERVAFWDSLPFRNKPIIDSRTCVL